MIIQDSIHELLKAVSLLIAVMPEDEQGPCPWCADYFEKDDPEPHENSACLYLQIWKFLKEVGVEKFQ